MATISRNAKNSRSVLRWRKVSSGNKSDLPICALDTIDFTLDAPTNLVAADITDIQVDLTWTNATGNNGYTIERSVGDNLNYSVLATVSVDTAVYSDNTTVEGTLYYYRVKTVGGVSLEYSNEAFITTPVPFTMSIVTTDNTFAVETSGVRPYDYYVRWENQTNVGVNEGSAAGQTGTYTLTGLSNSDTYKIKILGTFPRVYYAVSAHATKIQTLDKWGDVVFGIGQSESFKKLYQLRFSCY